MIAHERLYSLMTSDGLEVDLRFETTRNESGRQSPPLPAQLDNVRESLRSYATGFESRLRVASGAADKPSASRSEAWFSAWKRFSEEQGTWTPTLGEENEDESEDEDGHCDRETAKRWKGKGRMSDLVSVDGQPASGSGSTFGGATTTPTLKLGRHESWEIMNTLGSGQKFLKELRTPRKSLSYCRTTGRVTLSPK